MNETSSKLSNTRRCCVCQRKVGWDYYECKCNPDLKFCSNHRYPFAHNCCIDKSLQHRKQLEVANPKLTLGNQLEK